MSGEAAHLAALQEQAKELFGDKFGKEHPKATLSANDATSVKSHAAPTAPAGPDQGDVQHMMRTARGRMMLTHKRVPVDLGQQYIDSGRVIVVDRGFYVCGKCGFVFNIDDFVQRTVWYYGEGSVYEDKNYNDEPEEHDCDLVYVTSETGTEEIAWLCGNGDGGCFHHDEGPKPREQTVYQCSECEIMFASFWAAKECWDHH